ncbi:hypothetical protein ILUMI_16650, partial [Ignelater luminosus]
QRDGITGVSETYENLLKRCIRTALEMRARGVTPNDIISLCSLNHFNSCVPVIAASFLGATLSCLDPMLSLNDTVYLIKQVRPKMIFVGEESVALIEGAVKEAQLQTEIVVFGLSTVHSEFADFFAPKENENFRPVEVENNKETALILFSSGTTGLPKGICLSHYSIMRQSYNIVDVGFNADCGLAYASFYWISAHVMLLGVMYAGGSRLILPRYNPVQYWKLLDQFKVTLVFMAPSQAIAMYNKGRPDGINTTHLSELLIGGGPLAAEYIIRIRDILPGTNVSLIYGQTEIAGIGLYFSPNRREDILALCHKPGSCGRPVPDLTCKIVDPETEETLGPNQRGELRLKSPFILNGYYNLDSSAAWDENGWLKTGDIACYDEDGCLYIVDRIKEMLKFRAYHVAPAAIEGILLGHPSIAGAVVIGIPHVEDGDHPAAAVVLRDPQDKITPEEIVKYIEGKVDDRQKLRGGVMIISKIPTTATGKIRRNDVKKLFLEKNS